MFMTAILKAWGPGASVCCVCVGVGVCLSVCVCVIGKGSVATLMRHTLFLLHITLPATLSCLCQHRLVGIEENGVCMQELLPCTCGYQV